MKRFAIIIMLLSALGMLAACGGGSSSTDVAGSNLGGVGANAPIVGALVTVTDLNGNVVASGTTGANGYYTVSGAVNVSPFIVTVAATPTSTFANGNPFKGELKGLFTSDTPTGSLMVTVPSSILYKIWDEMGRPSDITSAQNAAVAMFQMMGMDTTSVASMWTTNPVGLDYEILQQQLVFFCGIDDGAGAGEIFTKAASLAETYVTSADPGDDLANLVTANTGLDVSAGGFQSLLATDAVKNQIASSVQAGLTGTSASGAVSSIDDVITRVRALVDNAAAFGDYPAAIVLGGAGGISNSSLTKVITYGGSAGAYAVSIAGKQVDNGAASASAFTITSADNMTFSGAVSAVNTAFSAGTVNFTLNSTTVPGTYPVTVKYTEGTKSMSLTFYFKVIGDGVPWATGVRLDAERIQFTSTDDTKVPAHSTYTTTSTTKGYFTPTQADTYIAAFFLPDGMYFVDSSNQFWPNWDVTVTASDTSQQTPTIPSKTVKANKDLSFGEYTWTFRVFDVNRDTLMASATNGSSIVYTSQAQTNATVRFIGYNTVDISNNANATSLIYYGAPADSAAAGRLKFDSSLGDNEYVTLGTDVDFNGVIQTWAQAAGDTSSNATLHTDAFYLNVKSNNYDSYTKNYGFGTGNFKDNMDVSSSALTWVSANKWCTFNISLGDSGNSSVNFYPDYAVGQTNIDKVRIGYDYDLNDIHTSSDTLSSGVTFKKY